MKHLILGLFVCASMSCGYAEEPLLIADFEGTDYGKWSVTGDAFGAGPARGTLPGQMVVEGFQGKGLVNSFVGGDDATGKLVSPVFTIQRKFIKFLIGGGAWADETCIHLMVGDRIVRTATGPNLDSGGSERLVPMAWDVSEFVNQNATIAIVDQRKGGWGHINVDQIEQVDERGNTPIAPLPVVLQRDVVREIVVTQKFLHFPVKNGGRARVVEVSSDGMKLGRFDIELADGQPDWWAPYDVSAWMGKKLTIQVNTLPVDSMGLNGIQQSGAFLGTEDLYREPLRSQFHFSPKRGWTNDPNGLVFYQGEYHLFFQHNPFGWGWGNMHWGHATSKDLVHWVEHGDVLAPDEFGPMFSGSAVVDWNNTSGFGKDNQPPLVLMYTAAGNPTTQCIAYSTDGRHFTKYEGNPVIQQISGGNRDPKVIWHEPSKRWVMVLYVETAGKQHTVHFFSSRNLREWELIQVADGGIDADKYLYECPDFFALPVDDDKSKMQWVLNAANSEYAIGSFDGKTFRAESSRIQDVRGRGFYAAQTFSDVADGRRIQIGWMQAPSPGMSFNQLQSIPCEMKLRTTSEGVRIHRVPVEELVTLRKSKNQANNLAPFKSELIELRAEFVPDPTNIIEFELRGAKISYDASKQELQVDNIRIPAPLKHGKQNLIVYVDKTMLEVFACDGLVYAPLPWIPKAGDLSVKITDKQGRSKMESLEVYALESSWPKQP